MSLRHRKCVNGVPLKYSYKIRLLESINLLLPKTNKQKKIIICDKNSVYGFYFVSYMNIIFNELRQQRVNCDDHTTNKIKHTRHFYHIIFIANLSAILIGTIL